MLGDYPSEVERVCTVPFNGCLVGHLRCNVARKRIPTLASGCWVGNCSRYHLVT